MRMRSIAAAATAAALLALGACSDDDAGGRWPSLAALWPHADGSTWTYEAHREIRTGDVDLPPDLPTMEEAHAALAAALPGTVSGAHESIYTFALDGTLELPGGLTVQAVANTVELPEDGEDGFEPFAASASGLLGGTAFAFRDSGYYRYGGVALPTWVYVEGPLRPGTEFGSHWPAAADSPRSLRARIWSVADRTLGGVAYRDVVECVYLKDLGESTAGDATVRNHMVGRVWYAPGVGPVAWQEQIWVLARTAYDPAGMPTCVSSRGVLLEAVLPDAD